MDTPFPIVAVDYTLAPAGQARIDVRQVGGDASSGFAIVGVNTASVVVHSGAAYATVKNNQFTSTLQSSEITTGTPSVVDEATYTRADMSATNQRSGVVQTGNGRVLGFAMSSDTSNANPQITLFDSGLSVTFTGPLKGVGRSGIKLVGWMSFDGGDIADLAAEAYI